MPARIYVDVDRLKELRNAAGLTQATLADESGTSKRSIENIESKGIGSIGTLTAIANALQVEVTELIRPAESKRDQYDHAPALRPYLQSLRRQMGTIQFVGLPELRDEHDISLADLFIEPRLSAHEIDPAISPDQWPALTSIAESLQAHSALVILGGPGSGKSTLIKWLVWSLCAARKNQLRTALEDRVPLPFLLRELSVNEQTTWESLLDSFARNRLADGLPAGELQRLFVEGKALLLLDGIDELGGIPARQALRDAVWDGMRRYPRCRVVCTSRVTGYDEVPFDRYTSSQGDEPDCLWGTLMGIPVSNERGDIVNLITVTPQVPRPMERQFIAPFDDAQIAAFCQHWYRLREATSAEAGRRAGDLIRAIAEHPSTRALARNPNLLTLMALIHRTRAQLPHGRALLYSQIADAYLETIDQYRGLAHGPDTLNQKRRWLALVAYNAQQRRSKEDDAAIQISATDLEAWVGEAMRGEGKPASEADVRAFIDRVRRRSGLLVESAEGLYSFVHLSFQEYFAACHLREIIQGPDAAEAVNLAASGLWRESLVFLFELVHDSRRERQLMRQSILGTDWPAADSPDELWPEDKVALLARLAIDPYVGWDFEREESTSQTWHERATDALCDWILPKLAWESCETPHDAARILLTETESRGMARRQLFKLLLEKSARGTLPSLNLNGTPISDLTLLKGLTSLQRLSLDSTPVTDLTPLKGLTSLQRLSFDSTPVTDLTPLKGLTSLQRLFLNSTPVADLTPLKGLTNLQGLYLDFTLATDLTPLKGLTSLQRLFLNSTPVADLTPLKGLTNLQGLYLDFTLATDLTPLKGLTSLQGLYLNSTPVTDLTPLKGLTSLQWMYLNSTPVVDLTPLKGLTSLQRMYLNSTPVVDLTPLKGLTSLQTLHLDSTQVADLTPLKGLTSLQTLHLDSTQVADLTPLKGLTSLQLLTLRSTPVSYESIAELRKSRPDLYILV